MAGTELFGAPLGDRAFLEDQHTRGLTRLQNAEADKAEMEVQQDRQFAQLMRVASTGGSLVPNQQDPNDPNNSPFGSFSAPDDHVSSRLSSLALLATQAGLVKKGAALAKDAATINARYSSAAASQAIAQLRQIRQRKEEAGMMGSVLEDVNDQDSFDRALAAYQLSTGKPSRFAGLPYSPELVDRLRSQATAVRDQNSQRLREAEASSREAYRNSRLDQIDNAQEISMAARGVQRDREGRLVKLGTGRVQTVSNQERDAASALITKDYPELGDPGKNSERYTAANTVASEAKVLMQRNPALAWSEALAQAYTQERANFKADETYGGLGRRKVRFEGGGKSPQTAVPIPREDDKLVVGKYYYDSRGRIGQWTGEGLKPVGPMGAAKGRAEPESDDEGDEEDTE